MIIGEKIKYYRKFRGYTQKDLATLMGKSLDTIKKYEAGTTTPPLKSIEQIASVLNILPSFLLSDSKSNENSNKDDDEILKAFNDAIKNGADKRDLMNFERNYTEILKQYSSLTDFTSQDAYLFLYATISDILLLSAQNKSMGYSIKNFEDKEISELSKFVFNSYQLKVNEIMERKKLKEGE